MARTTIPWTEGYVLPNLDYGLAYRVMSSMAYPKIKEIIQNTLASALIYLPSSSLDLKVPELRPYLDQFVRGSNNYGAEQRIKLMKLLWDAIGTEFGGRHELYERNYFGNHESIRFETLMVAELTGASAKYKGFAEQCMRLKVILGVVLLVANASVVVAQITSATVSGTIKDETGGVLPGVNLVIANLDTGLTRSVVTDSNGYFTVPGLAPGRYEARASLQGFRTGVQTGITLQVGQDAGLNFVLSVGATAESITVSGESALVETRSAALSAIVLEKTIEELPLNGRNYIMLRKFAERLNFWLANLITSGLFVAIHLPGWMALHTLKVENAVTIFIFGIVMGGCRTVRAGAGQFDCKRCQVR